MKVLDRRVWGADALLEVLEGCMEENRNTTCRKTFQVKKKRIVDNYIYLLHILKVYVF